MEPHFKRKVPENQKCTALMHWAHLTWDKSKSSVKSPTVWTTDLWCNSEKNNQKCLKNSCMMWPKLVVHVSSSGVRMVQKQRPQKKNNSHNWNYLNKKHPLKVQFSSPSSLLHIAPFSPVQFGFSAAMSHIPDDSTSKLHTNPPGLDP